jgi:hypothetical protein
LQKPLELPTKSAALNIKNMLLSDEPEQPPAHAQPPAPHLELLPHVLPPPVSLAPEVSSLLAPLPHDDRGVAAAAPHAAGHCHRRVRLCAARAPPAASITSTHFRLKGV